MDFLANQEGSPPVVTAAMLLDVILGRHGLTVESVSMPANVLLAITPHSIRLLRRLLVLGEPERFQVAGASIYKVPNRNLAVVGPSVGAPIAAAVIESLAALGVRRVVGLGWCGSVHPCARVGDLIVVERALREEGVSYHYSPAQVPAQASPLLLDALVSSAAQHEKTALTGTIWTTDALYREARAKVAAMGAAGALAVEMEASAIYVVAAHCGIDAAILLVVSDELCRPVWQPGFFERDFHAAHQIACQVAVAAYDLLPLDVDRLYQCT